MVPSLPSPLQHGGKVTANEPSRRAAHPAKRAPGARGRAGVVGGGEGRGWWGRGASPARDPAGRESKESRDWGIRGWLLSRDSGGPLEPAGVALQEPPRPGMGWGPRGPPPPGRSADLEFSLRCGGGGGRTTAPTSSTRSLGAAPCPIPELTRSLRPSPSWLGHAAAGRERRALESRGGRGLQSGHCPPLPPPPPPASIPRPRLGTSVLPPLQCGGPAGHARQAAAQPRPGPRAPLAPFGAVPRSLEVPLCLALPSFTWHCT